MGTNEFAGGFRKNGACCRVDVYKRQEKSLAFLAGGETVVKLTGKGLGGRNQELALAAAPGISGLKDTAVFSFGSDGTCLLYTSRCV